LKRKRGDAITRHPGVAAVLPGEPSTFLSIPPGSQASYDARLANGVLGEAMKDLHQLGVVEAAAAIRSGEITAEDLATALLQRAKALNALNAFVNLDEAIVLDAARAADLHRASGKALGSLHGVPIALKDNINTAAFPTTAGTP
jgi:hypothetical protein